MKLHKKKVKLLLAGIVILTIVSSVLCSFTLPDYGTTPIYVENVTQTDAQNVMAIVDFQSKTGQFNNLLPIVCYMNGAKTELWLLLVNPEISYTLEYTSYNFTVTNNNENPSLYYRYRFYLKTGGFSTGAPETNYDSGNGFSTYTALNPIFVRPTSTSEMQINTSFAFKTGVLDNDDLRDIAVEWYDFYDRNVNFDEKISEAESQGYGSGFNQGYADGLDQGFADGLDEGESRGYQSGLSDGYTDGFDKGVQAGYNSGLNDGYDSGFYNGYTEGYDDGYAAAEPGAGEVVTEIVYRDAVEINVGEVISGISSMPQNLIGSAFGFELFGINIAGLLTTLIVLAVGGFIVGLFIKKR